MHGTDFFRFPQTPHIAWLSGKPPREDKVLSESQVVDFLSADVLVEEKIDGANLGFSLAADGRLLAQNRGQYLEVPYVGQFVRLADWLALHGDDVHKVLHASRSSDLILFGEWCAARHSLYYDALPDWFLLFDVYERKTNRFWSSARRNQLANSIGLSTPPKVWFGHCALTSLKQQMVKKHSQLRSGGLEGIVIRCETTNWCEARAKLVNADFVQSIDAHWRSRKLQWNRLGALESKLATILV